MGTSFSQNSQIQKLGTENLTIRVDEVATLAYEKFLARGRLDGYDVEDWAAAEQELKDRLETKRNANDGFEHELSRPAHA